MNRPLVQASLGLAALLSVTGCASSGAAADSLHERLAAAGDVSNQPMRDRAYGSVALDAAAGGQVEICLRALRSIDSVEVHDDSAAKAALLERSAGSLADARRIAMTIQSLAARDAVLAAIAESVK